jgi:hypothetical protein
LICEHIEKLASDLNRPVIYLASAKTSKEQTAKEILTANPIDAGLICALSVVEYCQNTSTQNARRREITPN